MSSTFMTLLSQHFKNFFNVETAKYSWNLKVKAIYDSDDEGEGEYTVERFKKDLNRVGKKEKNDDDKEYNCQRVSHWCQQQKSQYISQCCIHADW